METGRGHSCKRCEYVRSTEKQLFELSADSGDTLLFPELDSGPDSFRLLRLLPSLTEGAPLSCLLFSATRVEWKDKYVAASYVCGSPIPKETIYINGSKYHVGLNVFAFLHALEQYCKLTDLCMGMVIWIDAICIDQRSLKERNHQVSMMRNIFQNAEATYSWLGNAGHDSDWALDAMLSSRGRQQNLASVLATSAGKPTKLGLSKSLKRLKTFFQGLTNTTYFTRLWILQEFVLPTRVRLFCGSKNLHFTLLAVWIEYTTKDTSVDIESSEYSSRRFEDSMLWKMYKMRKTRFMGSSFEELFHDFGSLACALSHDKLYALHGFTNTREQDRLPVLYEKPVGQLLALSLGECIDPLRFVQEALQHLRIDPLRDPISLKLTQRSQRYERPSMDMSVRVNEAMEHHMTLSECDGTSSTLPVFQANPLSPSSYSQYYSTVIRLTSLQTFTQHLVVVRGSQLETQEGQVVGLIINDCSRIWRTTHGSWTHFLSPFLIYSGGCGSTGRHGSPQVDLGQLQHIFITMILRLWPISLA